jgi:hypothetical protein
MAPHTVQTAVIQDRALVPAPQERTVHGPVRAAAGEPRSRLVPASGSGTGTPRPGTVRRKPAARLSSWTVKDLNDQIANLANTSRT